MRRQRRDAGPTAPGEEYRAYDAAPVVILSEDRHDVAVFGNIPFLFAKLSTPSGLALPYVASRFSWIFRGVPPAQDFPPCRSRRRSRHEGLGAVGMLHVLDVADVGYPHISQVSDGEPRSSISTQVQSLWGTPVSAHFPLPVIPQPPAPVLPERRDKSSARWTVW